MYQINKSTKIICMTRGQNKNDGVYYFYLVNNNLFFITKGKTLLVICPTRPVFSQYYSSQVRL